VYAPAYTPTVYAPAYTPTVYAPSYLPTTAYYPTVINTPLVASASSACCNEAAPAVTTPAPSAPRSSSNTGTNERAPSSIVESVPANEPSYEPRPAPGPAPDSGTPTPPVAPVPERETSTAPPPAAADTLPSPGPVPAPAPSSEVNPPVAPSAPDSTAPTPAEPAPTLLRRQARKPVAPPAVRPPALKTLEGKVVSGDTRQAEEGVRIIVSSRAGNFVDRVATTNSQGQYAVKLPEGDWTVKVAMPSGRVYAVSQITISGGQIVDDSGRDIPSLIITR
jgi:hypothetical protein